MIIVMRPEATEKEIEFVEKKLIEYGFKTHLSKGVERTIIGAIGDERALRDKPLSSLPGVEKVVPILKPYKLVSKDFKKEPTVLNIKGVKIGGKHIAVMAGPCSVESRELLFEVAESVYKAGARILRGGAFKPRTSPYSFQGLGEEGLKYLREVADHFGMLVITELMDPRDLDLVAKYADILQIGARNMSNFRLLKEVGKAKMPVMLKRGMCATIKEFLMAAEYIASEGNYDIILCERGIRSFDTETRNTLDLAAVPVIKNSSHLPIIVDPSHGTGRRDCILPMAQAAIAAGADGLMVEVHPRPSEALSDGDQSILPSDFEVLMKRVRVIAATLEKHLEE
ncbi:3-deoxy-7-phosphoheptulonate synthase [Deferribacter thermophilus]|uniref:3-deoxy-7-phosphoheptulonate synthase n=1 Tax=Deferribacter desulfuricans (strain DSM 14783 / JCM 11476 / NBRC 101012 / SSM1) TaxID=639282 RepID=D3PA08_DEFDS|nr:3-deoxy-7-phosphoheptulonate synthase [Deferribacter desulfuricans]BAI81548.1 3-deoxy-7-phosphoheptulonate synthase [Deferribacter desulfuricans SSM1]